MKKIIFIILGILVINASTAQSVFNPFKEVEEKMENASTSKWQNIKKFIEADLLNNRYYQALVKNGFLKQTDNEYQLKSTIYGLIRIFDSTKQEKQFFQKNTWARNTTIGLGAVMGEDNNINALNTSLAINLLNGREIRASKLFDETISKEKLENATKIFDKVLENAEKTINGTNADKTKEVLNQLADFNKSKINFSLLKGLLTDEEISECKSTWEALNKRYDEIKSKLDGAPSLVYKYEGNYTNTSWQKINNSLEFLVGLGNSKSKERNYDFYAGLFYNATQDTTKKTAFLNRTQFTFKTGINAVLLKDSEGNSTFEALGGAEFVNTSKGLYVGEMENNFKLDLTLSVRLSKNLFLPFQLKYNQTTGRFEGYIDLKMHVFTRPLS